MLKITFSHYAEKNLKFLKRKFQKIEKDLERLFSQLNLEKLPGDQVRGLKGLPIYKARIRNSSAGLGEKAGFRVVYYLRRKNQEIFILAIYSKNQKTNISQKEILEILRQENLFDE